MKHFLHNSLRAMFLSLAVLLSLPMMAVEVEIDGIDYEFNGETKEATVIKKSSGWYSGKIVIPETVEYNGTVCSVTSIGEKAFNGCSGLTSVTIGNSVESIGDYAFDYCSGLTSVTIGNSVTSIGKRAFQNCSGLNSVTIPNSVESIGDNAFYECTGLTSVHISDIAAWCNIEFYGYNSNPLRYAHHLYLNGEEVKDLIIPNSVESIGDYAFASCPGLTSVTIPNSVTSIEGSAFAYCSGLTSVTIGNSVTSIGEYAFQHCSGLTSVTIGNSVTSIGESAFYYCSGLTSVTIGNSVTSIGESAFYGCSGLTSVTIPNSVTSIGGSAFASCSGLTSVTIGNSVTSIGGYAFAWCYGLTSVTIPNSVTSIGSHAFYGCTGLTSVTIPNSVTSIGEYAFYYCSGLTSVTIPNSVTSIGESAFYGCSGLTSVTIPNSVTSIGESAFYGCSGLTSVTIGSGVEYIDYAAFANCPELLDVYCYAEKVPSTSNAFYGSYTVYATLHVPAASINSYRTTEPWSVFGTIVAITTEVDGINYDFDAETKQATVIAKSSAKYSGEVVIPESVEHEGIAYSVTSIGSSAFEGCSGLTSVHIPNSVTSIGPKAFDGCSGLTSVTIPNSVTSIEDFTFAVCSGLTSVTIPNSVTSIGNGAFESCSGLTSVIIPNSVRSIGWSTFMYCRGLTSVTIPNNVESIGGYAFYACSGLTSVTIGRSVRSIGEVSFSFCSELLDVYCYAENVPSTESNAYYGSYPEYATLHVPASSIDSYKAEYPWGSFGKIVALTDEEHIVDGTLEEYVNESERSPIDIHYTRTLPNMLWNPLYVPFKIPYEDLQENYEVAYINAMHSYDNDDNGEIDDMVMEIVKIKAGTLKPNHPYLIKAKTTEAMEMSIVQENTTLYPAEITTLDCSSVYTKFEITGTYQEMTSGDLNGSLVISTDGAWKKLSSTSTLKPFRFYLTISSREGSPVEIADEAMSRVRIRVMCEDDNATGIDETENGKVKTENSVVFDLSGRRVSAPAKGGVYIVNAKKVIY